MLKKNKKLILIIIPLMLVIGGVIYGTDYGFNTDLRINDTNLEKADYVKEGEIEEVEVEVNHYYYEALKKIDDLEKININAQGGVVPHHDLSSELNAQFFAQLQKQNPDIKRFILIGPKHNDQGYKAYSGTVAWQTPEGTVEQDFEVLEELKNKNLIEYFNSGFIDEHSLKFQMPFIKHSFPDAKVVPIVLTSKNSLRDCEHLAQELQLYLDEETVIVASIDFSHYLPSGASEYYDEITLQRIENKDYENLMVFDNSYLDSPPSIVTILKAMEINNSAQVRVLAHNNSADFMGRPLDVSTSYFTLFFH